MPGTPHSTSFPINPSICGVLSFRMFSLHADLHPCWLATLPFGPGWAFCLQIYLFLFILEWDQRTLAAESLGICLFNKTAISPSYAVLLSVLNSQTSHLLATVCRLVILAVSQYIRGCFPNTFQNSYYCLWCDFTDVIIIIHLNLAQTTIETRPLPNAASQPFGMVAMLISNYWLGVVA